MKEIQYNVLDTHKTIIKAIEQKFNHPFDTHKTKQISIPSFMSTGGIYQWHQFIGEKIQIDFLTLNDRPLDGSIVLRREKNSPWLVVTSISKTTIQTIKYETGKVVPITTIMAEDVIGILDKYTTIFELK